MKDKTKQEKKNISIRAIISIIFISFLLVTSSMSAYIVFNNWIKTTDDLTLDFARSLNEDIFSEVKDFMETPLHLTLINGDLLEMNLIDLENRVDRNRFFISILQSHSDKIHNIIYATEKGDMYGARKRNGNVEILEESESTPGFYMYYEITQDFIVGDLIAPAGAFNPTTFSWYIDAKQRNKTTFSPVSKHISMDDLTVTASSPIYNIENEFVGVLSTQVLLTSIDDFLLDLTRYQGEFSIIVEKQTGEVVASSLDLSVLRSLDGGITRRLSVNESERDVAIKAYEHFLATDETESLIKDSNSDSFYINVNEYLQDNLDWLIISSVPKNIFSETIIDNIIIAIILTFIMTLVITVLYYLLMRKFLNPLSLFENAAKRFSEGDMSQRIPVVRNDEIGKISITFNEMADQVSHMVLNLENIVDERTAQLKDASLKLKEYQNKLELILNSTAEGIYGIDLDGSCTFCNHRCLELLGFDSEDELLGKNMHDTIHHSFPDGRFMNLSECSIHKALVLKNGVSVQDDVFWKKDGSQITVDYSSFPQISGEKVVGAVITFTDNSVRKENEEKLRYFHCHDALTGLLNRNCFQEELPQLDVPSNLPISVIFGDVTGLKLTNDIFGHSAGDQLIIECANAMRKASRQNDIIARIGGDEFIMVLPKTSSHEASKIANMIKGNFSGEVTEAIKYTMPLGFDTKYTKSQDILDIIDSAENKMYKKKVLDRKSTQIDLIDNILHSLFNKSTREKLHAENVSSLCKMIAEEMGLSGSEVKKMERAGYLHDIGKIILDESVLNKQRSDYTRQEKRSMQQHAISGFKILNLFDETLDLADPVYSHHEYWDGSGYPKGLKGEEIPLISRIISVAERFDTRTDRFFNGYFTKEQAVDEIKKLAGIKFDPQVVEAFLNTLK